MPPPAHAYPITKENTCSLLGIKYSAKGRVRARKKKRTAANCVFETGMVLVLVGAVSWVSWFR